MTTRSDSTNEEFKSWILRILADYDGWITLDRDSTAKEANWIRGPKGSFMVSREAGDHDRAGVRLRGVNCSCRLATKTPAGEGLAKELFSRPDRTRQLSLAGRSPSAPSGAVFRPSIKRRGWRWAIWDTVRGFPKTGGRVAAGGTEVVVSQILAATDDRDCPGIEGFWPLSEGDYCPI